MIQMRTFNSLLYLFLLAGTYSLTTNAQAQIFVSQRSQYYSGDRLGTSSDTIGTAGCAITAVTMAIRSYGRYDVNPRTMNDFLKSNGGYSGGELIRWDVADRIDGCSGFTYVGSGTITAIANLKTLLNAGYRVVARSNRFSQHWVFLAGYVNGGQKWSDFLYADPWDTSYVDRRLGDGWVQTGNATRYYDWTYSA